LTRAANVESVTRAANVESKARCGDLAGLAERAAGLGARFAGVLEQEDVYFEAREGRLKLRQTTHRLPDGETRRHAELIRYARPDRAGARVSVYERTEVEDPVDARARLAAGLGVRGVVRKRRDLWLIDSTRIHLDRVEGLGGFVEIETVAGGDVSASTRAEHDRVAEALGVDAEETVEGSYIDLLVAAAPP
jgi:predicted adenylyl cyclase CyaB